MDRDLSLPFVERRRDEQDPNAVRFVLQLGRALHGAGHSAHRLEDILGATANRLGLHGHQFFSTPTSIMASFGPLGRQRTHMLRIEPGEVDLGRLAALESVALEVAQGRASVDVGILALTDIEAAEPRYGPVLTTLGYGLVSGAAAQFLGAGGREVAVATGLGLGLGLFALVAARHPRLGRVFETLAAFLVSAPRQWCSCRGSCSSCPGASASAASRR